jgi:hypothetical protein
MEIAFGDKPCLDSLKAFIQEYTLIIIKEIKGYDENIHNIGIFLDD